MQIVMQATVGSRLYGTTTPDSDLDKVTIYIPDGQTILTQRIERTYKKSTSTNNERNGPDDTDETFIALHTYVNYLLDGNMQHGIELLYTTPEKSSDVWEYIVANRQKFFSKSGQDALNWFKGNLNDYRSYKKLSDDYANIKRRYHLARIGLQLEDFYNLQDLRFPFEGHTQQTLLDIKQNKYSHEWVKDFLESCEEGITTAYNETKMQQEPYTEELIEPAVLRPYYAAVNDYFAER